MTRNDSRLASGSVVHAHKYYTRQVLGVNGNSLFIYENLQCFRFLALEMAEDGCFIGSDVVICSEVSARTALKFEDVCCCGSSVPEALLFLLLLGAVAVYVARVLHRRQL